MLYFLGNFFNSEYYFEIYPYFYMYQYLFIFITQYIPLHADSTFLNHSHNVRHLDCFPFGTIKNLATVNIHVHICLHIHFHFI